MTNSIKFFSVCVFALDGSAAHTGNQLNTFIKKSPWRRISIILIYSNTYSIWIGHRELYSCGRGYPCMRLWFGNNCLLECKSYKIFRHDLDLIIYRFECSNEYLSQDRRARFRIRTESKLYLLMRAANIRNLKQYPLHLQGIQQRFNRLLFHYNNYRVHICQDWSNTQWMERWMVNKYNSKIQVEQNEMWTHSLIAINSSRVANGIVRYDDKYNHFQCAFMRHISQLYFIHIV